MDVRVSYGGLSNTFVTMTVEPSATGIDILNALKEANALGVDPEKERYVVTIAKNGQNLPANQSLVSADIREGDQLIIVSSEQGYTAR